MTRPAECSSNRYFIPWLLFVKMVCCSLCLGIIWPAPHTLAPKVWVLHNNENLFFVCAWPLVFATIDSPGRFCLLDLSSLMSWTSSLVHLERSKAQGKCSGQKKSWSIWPLYLTSNTFKHVWLWLHPPPSFSIQLDYSYCHKSRYNCEINYWLFSDFVYAICQAQLCLYSLFEYDVLVRIWMHSRRGEELC